MERICPCCGQTIKQLDQEYLNAFSQIRIVERSNGRITTKATSAVIGYSERQTLRILKWLEGAGYLERYGPKSGWYSREHGANGVFLRGEMIN